MKAPRLDRFEAAVLATLFALSVAVLAGLLIRVWVKGGVVTGGDGYLVVDPLQYLNWLRQTSELYDSHKFFSDLEQAWLLILAAVARPDRMAYMTQFVRRRTAVALNTVPLRADIT